MVPTLTTDELFLLCSIAIIFLYFYRNVGKENLFYNPEPDRAVQ